MPAPTRTTLIDAVNERDERVGTVARGDALREGRNFRTAHVFVADSDGSLLLQRLTSQRNRHPGRWGSSVAAYLFAGEDYLSGAERRLREELGLTTALDPMGKLEMRDEHSLKFVCLFLSRSDRAEIAEPDHISELRYWPALEIEQVIERDPAQFTPTFVALYNAFGWKLG